MIISEIKNVLKEIFLDGCCLRKFNAFLRFKFYFHSLIRFSVQIFVAFLWLEKHFSVPENVLMFFIIAKTLQNYRFARDQQNKISMRLIRVSKKGMEFIFANNTKEINFLLSALGWASAMRDNLIMITFIY